MVVFLENVYGVISQSGVHHLDFGIDCAVALLKVYSDVASTYVCFDW